MATGQQLKFVGWPSEAHCSVCHASASDAPLRDLRTCDGKLDTSGKNSIVPEGSESAKERIEYLTLCLDCIQKMKDAVTGSPNPSGSIITCHSSPITSSLLEDGNKPVPNSITPPLPEDKSKYDPNSITLPLVWDFAPETSAPETEDVNSVN